MKVTSQLKVKTNYKAKATIDYETYRKVRHLVNKVPTECQWYHTVERSFDEDTITFHLSDIFIPPQKVTGATVESSPEEVANMWEGYKETRGVDEVNGLIPLTTCWCHSHVNMVASPSGTDETQWKEWCKQILPKKTKEGSNIRIIEEPTAVRTSPPVMIITNKQDDWFIRATDTEFNMEFEYLPIEVVNTPPEADYPDINELVASNIKPKVTTSIVPINKSAINTPWPRPNNTQVDYSLPLGLAHQTGVIDGQNSNESMGQKIQPLMDEESSGDVFSKLEALTHKEALTLYSILQALQSNNSNSYNYKLANKELLSTLNEIYLMPGAMHITLELLLGNAYNLMAEPRDVIDVNHAADDIVRLSAELIDEDPLNAIVFVDTGLFLSEQTEDDKVVEILIDFVSEMYEDIEDESAALSEQEIAAMGNLQEWLDKDDWWD